MVEDVINISEHGEELVVDCENVPDQVKASGVYKNIIESPGHHPSGIETTQRKRSVGLGWVILFQIIYSQWLTSWTTTGATD